MAGISVVFKGSQSGEFSMERKKEDLEVLSFFPLLREMNEAGSELQPCK